MGGEILLHNFSFDGKEVLVGYSLPRSVKLGFLKYKSYYVLITNKRLIFNRYTKAMRKAHEQSLNEKVKNQSFKERLSSIANHHVTLPSEYLTMDLESLAGLHEENFVLPLEQIKSVKRRHRTVQKTGGSSGTEEHLKIITQGKTYKIQPGYYDDMVPLNLVLGDKAKAKKMTFGL